MSPDRAIGGPARTMLDDNGHPATVIQPIPTQSQDIRDQIEPATPLGIIVRVVPPTHSIWRTRNNEIEAGEIIVLEDFPTIARDDLVPHPRMIAAYS